MVYRITDAHIRWCRIANPTQLHNCKSDTTETLSLWAGVFEQEGVEQGLVEQGLVEQDLQSCSIEYQDL